MRIIDCLEANPLELFNGADITDGKNYAYFAGNGKILLQAHIDTIYPAKKLRIVNNCITGDGLGADDRAGVFACLNLRQLIKNTPVLLTNFEESGGKGMKELTRNLSPDIFKNVNMAIAIDRQGASNYVTYNDLPKKCQRYVENYGWHAEFGTFSDIEIFTDYYKIPSVNVSAGYYGQHTKKEILVMDELELTIRRLKSMLKSPIQRRHIPKDDYYGGRWRDYERYDNEFYKKHAGYYTKFNKCLFCASDDIQEYGNSYYCNKCGEMWDKEDYSGMGNVYKLADGKRIV